MSVQIINADVMGGLAQLADESVHCCITSPPYWSLRDYQVEGQIGLEPTLQEHIAKLVDVFREVRRVLRSDGTLWLNYGDAYAGGGRGGNPDDSPFRKQATNAGSLIDPVPLSATGLKPKDLLMMPERLALALQADGWWVRARIIWAKPNPMPESVTDRPTKSHEHIWLLSKSPRYFYDAEAIRESDSGQDHPRNVLHKPEPSGGIMSPHAGIRRAEGRIGEGRNARDVWTIATAPFSEAHFATFPPALVERCILAGTSEKGCCAECGANWVREVRRSGGTTGKSWHDHSADAQRGNSRIDHGSLATAGDQPYRVETTGWHHSCTCNSEVVPCTVLDPFGGSGTTGLVADRLQRNAILIEINPQYAEMARRRIERDAGLFASVDGGAV